MNPFHVVPTLEDSDGFVVWESRAIAAYLIQSRGKGEGVAEELYPSDLKKRITVDKFLQYDLGTLYRAISDVVVSFQIKISLVSSNFISFTVQSLHDRSAEHGTNATTTGSSKDARVLPYRKHSWSISHRRKGVPS